ncbi:hypothetical protein E2C01_099719 [Portunus trituberculatus]|uniref:Uncharacterized protein n=1 Tax=Portunus trituberculatus TaxID=210409 RepID=A0A5B7KAB3_PORTR|nr:hypothetical protein [Portunus trituberculatus]
MCYHHRHHHHHHHRARVVVVRLKMHRSRQCGLGRGRRRVHAALLRLCETPPSTLPYLHPRGIPCCQSPWRCVAAPRGGWEVWLRVYCGYDG